MEIKPFFKSKTVWAQVLMVGAAIFTGLAELLGTTQTITLFAIINVALRAITKTGMSLLKGKTSYY